MKFRLVTSVTFLISLFSVVCCSQEERKPQNEPPWQEEFLFGADLSYVNQILDKGGIYRDKGVAADPYKIFSDHGTNLVRLRLWHNPVWTKEVYGEAGTQLYNDINDVALAITRSKALGMAVLLDFHYSDTWADPGKQHIPEAWKNITSITVLQDSIYNYTYKTLLHLRNRNLLPEYVQLGNETNCGMLYTDASSSFPKLNVCNGEWANMGSLLNAGIRAVRDASNGTSVDVKVILHVADPKNVEWWFDNINSSGSVTDYDIIGFSYYPLWHTSVQPEQISNQVSSFRSRFNKGVMILETAYPWTTAAADSYNNHFGNDSPLNGYPFTQKGQYDFLIKLVREVKEGGGIGVIYWEPAWITSPMKDLWGTGSSWENATFFDFDGNTHGGMNYMKFKY